MNASLQISPELALPLDAVTQTFAILAIKRAGKSNAAVVMAEEMYDHGLPWVAIDPKGDWWGVRAAGDGQSPGLSVLVFGGLHGDVPLEPTTGALVADLVVEQRITCVLDVSEMAKADQRRFLTAFVQRLYKKNREPLHVFCEEADEYIPQRVTGGDAQMVGAFETLVKRGGFRGIGITLITQRSASLNKDVLTQIETLIPMRTPSPQDRKAILSWVDYHAAGKELVDELPTLANGEAYVFSPQWLKTLTKITFRRRRTFDSGATPAVGAKVRPPTTLAEVNLDAIKSAMAEAIERIESENPKHLKAEVTRLRREVERLQRETKVVPPSEPEVVEVSVLDLADRDRLVNCWEQIEALQQQMARVLEKVAQADPGSDTPRISTPPLRRVSVPREMVEQNRPSEVDLARERVRKSSQQATSGSGVKLSKAERSILTVLAQYGDRTTSEIAMRAGYTVGGAFNNAMGSLRSKGYVLRGSPVSITPEGLEALGPFEPLPTGWALAEHFLANKTLKMGKAHRMILEYLRTCDEPQTAQQIAEATGYAIGGAFNNAMGRLRSLELVITQQGQNYLADELMED